MVDLHGESGPGSASSGTRTAMSSNQDPRATRTRQRLLSAFRQAMRESDELVSVSDLVERAQVNRTTFYSHFASTEELAVAAFTELFDTVLELDTAIRSEGDSQAATVSSIQSVLDFLDSDRRSYLLLLSAPSNTFARAVEHAFMERNRITLETMTSIPGHVDKALAARFVAAGMVAVMTWWLAETDPRPSSELADRIADVLPAWFTTS